MGREWDGADGFRRSLNEAADYRTVGVGQSSKPGIGDRDIEWPSGQGWNQWRCRKCGHLSHGGSPCRCERPDMARADNRWQLFQTWTERWAMEAYRVLKPGGYLLAFGGARTYHRMACGIEDAGFEVRDSIHWIYGSGFPKSLDVSRALDDRAGAQRSEVVGVKPGHEDFVGRDNLKALREGTLSEGFSRPWMHDPEVVARHHQSFAPVTELAQTYSGWGTALKPAHEPIIVARKPLIGTVADNVVAHGTGGINIDGCRTSTNGELIHTPSSDPDRRTGVVGTDLGFSGQDLDTFQAAQAASVERTNTLGRWPANLVLSHSDGCVQTGHATAKREIRVSHNTDTAGKNTYGSGGPGGGSHSEGWVPETVERWDCAEDCPVAEMDRQSGPAGGVSPASGPTQEGYSKSGSMSGHFNGMGDRSPAFHGDQGGASRFFPILGTRHGEPSAERTYQDQGSTDFAAKPGARRESAPPSERFPVFNYVPKASRSERNAGVDRNVHPTVKPVALMRWLVRLVSPKGAVVLDPFCGSGTTGVACVAESIDFIGIEQNPEYAAIAERRCAHAESIKPLTLFEMDA